LPLIYDQLRHLAAQKLAHSATSALLLRRQDLIRFVPDAGFHGQATLSVKAWDQTSGIAGTMANPAVGTAFSTAVGSLNVVVNTAPVLSS
jgi:hypothetical protein